jgi:hypothetical protein
MQVPPFRQINRSHTCAPVTANLSCCAGKRAVCRCDLTPTVTAIVCNCNAASPLLRAAHASRCSTVKRHFPFSSTRFNPVPLLESVCLLSLNMFTSLHDARSAQRTSNTPLKDANTLCCRCDAVTRRVQQSASEHQSPSVPLTHDVCSGWLARWRRRQTVCESVEGPACRWTSSRCSHRVLTRCLTQSRKGEHLRMLFNLRRC